MQAGQLRRGAVVVVLAFGAYVMGRGELPREP
jgi:hypothetical protein